MTAFSQTDTANLTKPITLSTDSVLCLPIGIARQIVVDLIRYDECIETVAIQRDLVQLQEDKIQTLDSLIKERELQYNLAREQIAALNEQVKIYEESNKRIAEKNRKLKKINIALLSATGTAAAIITAFILTK